MKKYSKLKQRLIYDAKDVIYLLSCGGCRKQYIAVTGELRSRVPVHKQQTRDPTLRTLYLSHHIAHCTIGKESLFRIVPFYFVNRGDRLYREEIEQHF